jgi:hypothetical protein
MWPGLTLRLKHSAGRLNIQIPDDCNCLSSNRLYLVLLGEIQGRIFIGHEHSCWRSADWGIIGPAGWKRKGRQRTGTQKVTSITAESALLVLSELL